MNKLRRLLIKRAETKGSEWDKATEEFNAFVSEHSCDLADLIDAAESQHTGCKVLRCDVCEALENLKGN